MIDGWLFFENFHIVKTSVQQVFITYLNYCFFNGVIVSTTSNFSCVLWSVNIYSIYYSYPVINYINQN